MLNFELSVSEVSNDPSQPSKKVSTFRLQAQAGQCLLSPDAIKGNIPNYDPQRQYGLLGNVSGSDVLLTIEGFPLVSIATFANARAVFPHLRIRGATQFARLNDVEVRRLDSDRSTLLLVDGIVHELNIGIDVQYNHLMARTEVGKEAPFETDIRGGQIDRTRIFVPHKILNVQHATLKTVRSEGPGATIELVRVWGESDINTLSIEGTAPCAANDLRKLDARTRVGMSLEYRSRLVSPSTAVSNAITRKESGELIKLGTIADALYWINQADHLRCWKVPTVKACHFPRS